MNNRLVNILLFTIVARFDRFFTLQNFFLAVVGTQLIFLEFLGATLLHLTHACLVAFD